MTRSSIPGAVDAQPETTSKEALEKAEQHEHSDKEKHIDVPPQPHTQPSTGDLSSAAAGESSHPPPHQESSVAQPVSSAAAGGSSPPPPQEKKGGMKIPISGLKEFWDKSTTKLEGLGKKSKKPATEKTAKLKEKEKGREKEAQLGEKVDEAKKDEVAGHKEPRIEGGAQAGESHEIKKPGETPKVPEKRVTIRRFGKRGGEIVLLPPTEKDLFQLAAETLHASNIVGIRMPPPTEARISFSLIRDEDILCFTTPEDEALFD